MDKAKVIHNRCKSCNKFIKIKSQRKHLKKEEILKVLNVGRSSNDLIQLGDVLCSKCVLLSHKKLKEEGAASTTTSSPTTRSTRKLQVAYNPG